MERLAGRRCRRLEAIEPFPVIFRRPLEQDLDRVPHLIVRSTKRQADGASGIERCEVLVSRVPGAPVGLHDVAHRARRQPPSERLSLPFGCFLRRRAELGHRPVSDAATVDPVLHGSRLRPGREVVEQVAALLAPAGGRAMLGRAGDAPAHCVNLALVGAAEGILALYLRHERHAPALLVESVYTFAPCHGADARAVAADASACIRPSFAQSRYPEMVTAMLARGSARKPLRAGQLDAISRRCADATPTS
jgi:hypothetical protein